MKQSTKIRLVALLCGIGAILLILLASAIDPTPVRALLKLTHVPIDRPSVYGVFHICWLLIGLALFVLLSILALKKGKDATDGTVFGFGMLFLVLELYKQLYSFYILCDGRYDFGVFPFQFCSLPLYFCLIAPFLREGWWKEAIYRFLALFGTMGGCLVLFYPAWFDTLSLCCHTMLWHVAMIALGLWILFSRGYGRSYLAEMLPAGAIFLGVTALATVLNVVLYPFSKGSPKPLNLFYMSPYHSTYFLIVKDVWRHLGWACAMLCYLALFILVGATLVWVVARFIRWILTHFSQKVQK
ncbi:MAG: YwaF family protein [Clostridia bacterium]|nr:YwaF family protein [Clostridia bacterium]